MSYFEKQPLPPKKPLSIEDAALRRYWMQIEAIQTGDERVLQMLSRIDDLSAKLVEQRTAWDVSRRKLGQPVGLPEHVIFKLERGLLSQEEILDIREEVQLMFDLLLQ